LTSTTSNLTPPTDAASRLPVLLVLGCTVLGAAAQIFMKFGANRLTHPGLIGIATNPPLLCGLALYGLSTVLLVLALKEGELSLLYPVIALTYVWVTVLSLFLLHDQPNPYKLVGIAIIVIGVSVLGRRGKK
jgi:multidrug transporter EmrE-like cation transporter